MLSMAVLLAMDHSRNRMEVNDPHPNSGLHSPKIWSFQLSKKMVGQDQLCGYCLVNFEGKDDMNVTYVYIYQVTLRLYGNLSNQYEWGKRCLRSGGRIFCLILKNHWVCWSWSHWGEDALGEILRVSQAPQDQCAVSTVDGSEIRQAS